MKLNNFMIKSMAVCFLILPLVGNSADHTCFTSKKRTQASQQKNNTSHSHPHAKGSPHCSVEFIFDQPPTNGCSECLKDYIEQRSDFLNGIAQHEPQAIQHALTKPGNRLFLKPNLDATLVFIDPKTQQPSEFRLIEKGNRLETVIQNNPKKAMAIALGIPVAVGAFVIKYGALAFQPLLKALGL